MNDLKLKKRLRKSTKSTKVDQNLQIKKIMVKSTNWIKIKKLTKKKNYEVSHRKGHFWDYLFFNDCKAFSIFWNFIRFWIGVLNPAFLVGTWKKWQIFNGFPLP